MQTKTAVDRREIGCVDSRHWQTGPQLIPDGMPDLRRQRISQLLQVRSPIAREQCSVVPPGDQR